MQIEGILPQTDNQERAFRAYDEGKHLMLSGSAGTGKTLISMYLALRDVQDRLYDRVVIVRSIVSARDPGFLPGSLKEKTAIYEAPYYSTCAELYGRGDAYGVLKDKGVVEFLTTSFVRGITLTDCVVVMDEVQNMRYHEIDSIVTRIGKNCRLVAIGDFNQSDLTRGEERRGIRDFIRVAQAMPSFELVEFTHKDILRSDVVREYLITRDELGINT